MLAVNSYPCRASKLDSTVYVKVSGMSGLYNIVVCASGGGGNFQALIDARAQLNVEISLLIVDRECGAIDRARAYGIPWVRLDTVTAQTLDAALPATVQLVVLAGFMPIIPAATCAKWRGKMINTHPSLLPKYGGKGMFGVKVQEAVLRAGETIAGCTVHYVSEDVDGGVVVAQKAIPVIAGETPWELGGRVFKEENSLLVEAVAFIKLSAKKEG
jgi:phosphoribosylglycinamide formyltransferase-1